jgi:hypothetical protein
MELTDGTVHAIGIGCCEKALPLVPKRFLYPTLKRIGLGGETLGERDIPFSR